MKLAALITHYGCSPGLKASLVENIAFIDKSGTRQIFKAGSRSDLLIDRGDGTYHFESDDHAIIVEEHEIEFLERTYHEQQCTN